ncbi:hypothetical protein KSP40_PGU007902 [Platanthera guangdongensis]|uniref:Uncharacterized protein n=1 Tax=Platanthera guangdongensis TaxID=2320717 RepID=A0ABR2ML13_9ASPA
MRGDMLPKEVRVAVEGVKAMVSKDEGESVQSRYGSAQGSGQCDKSLIKVEISEILSVSACADLTLPPGAGLCIDTVEGPVFLGDGRNPKFPYLRRCSKLIAPALKHSAIGEASHARGECRNNPHKLRWHPAPLLVSFLPTVADTWESLDGWLDAIRLVYTIYARGRSDVLAGQAETNRLVGTFDRGYWVRMTAIGDCRITSIGNEFEGGGLMMGESAFKIVPFRHSSLKISGVTNFSILYSSSKKNVETFQHPIPEAFAYLDQSHAGGLFAFGQDGEDLLVDPSLPSYGRCFRCVSDFLCGSQGLSSRHVLVLTGSCSISIWSEGPEGEIPGQPCYMQGANGSEQAGMKVVNNTLNLLPLV